jgi:hypothetical protein
MSDAKPVKFPSRAVFAAALIAGCVGCTNPAFVDSKDITHGKIGDLAIGMTKQQVLEIARKDHVHAIRPLLNALPTFNYMNLDELASLGDGRSIELDGGIELKVIYIVAHCKVQDIKILGGASAPPSISVGDSSESLIVNLKKILDDNHAFSVREVVSSDNMSWFIIDQPQHESYGSIDAYNIWSFEVTTFKPDGAEFVVYFSEGSVVRISYNRARIRLE